MDKLWWNHIIKARKLINDIVETAAGGKSILLSLPDKTPWKDTLLEIVEESLKIENPNNTVDFIDCPDQEIGPFLLSKYCKKEIRDQYRPGLTFAAFLAKCDDTVLNDRYVWVHKIPEDKIDEWTDFVSDYNSNIGNKYPGVFILETQGDYQTKKAKKSIREISFNQQITSYDKFTFCALAATDKSINDYIKPYFAELVALLCGEDIELCAECIKSGTLFLTDPIITINNIIETFNRSNYEPFEFTKSKETVETIIWETQLKNAFPMIEKYRAHFVNKHRSDIMKELPIPNSCGEEAEVPEDVEIGSLVYLTANRKISVSYEDYELLKLFKDARNSLAHLSTIDFSTLDTILKITKKL